MSPALDRPPVPVVALVASSGGLEAISTVLSGFTSTLPAAVLVLQHLESGRRSLLAEILAKRTPLEVEEARDGAPLRTGAVFVAPSGRHLSLDPAGVLRLTDAPPEHFSRPSADVLLRSLAGSGRPVVAIVLTGRGSDGASGSLLLHGRGGTVLAQDAETSRHYGMPGAAVLAGGVEESLPLDAIAGRVADLVQSLRRE